jgi:glycosyl transferase family 25
MRVYLINLDRAHDRLAHMQAQFNRVNAPFVRVSAVDAKVITKAELDDFRASTADAFRPHVWSSAQIGIFLSHKKIWADISVRGESHAAIFEDDVHLSHGISAVLRSTDWIDGSMDIIRLETTMQSMKLDQTPVGQVGKMKMFKVRSEAWGAAGYIIRRELAARLIAGPSQFYEPVDWLLFHPQSAIAPEINVFQLDPAPCVQDQYHPAVNCRRNFDKVTHDQSGLMYRFARGAKGIVSPLVRRLSGRRKVPFG